MINKSPAVCTFHSDHFLGLVGYGLPADALLGDLPLYLARNRLPCRLLGHASHSPILGDLPDRALLGVFLALDALDNLVAQVRIRQHR